MGENGHGTQMSVLLQRFDHGVAQSDTVCPVDPFLTLPMRFTLPPAWRNGVAISTDAYISSLEQYHTYRRSDAIELHLVYFTQ
nr:hypothetical protein CFP56_42108 [Quercus suber]